MYKERLWPSENLKKGVVSRAIRSTELESKESESFHFLLILVMTLLFISHTKTLTCPQSSTYSAGRDGYQERERKVRWVGRKLFSPILPSHHLLPGALLSLCRVLKTTGDESGENLTVQVTRIRGINQSQC